MSIANCLCYVGQTLGTLIAIATFGWMPGLSTTAFAQQPPSTSWTPPAATPSVAKNDRYSTNEAELLPPPPVDPPNYQSISMFTPADPVSGSPDGVKPDSVTLPTAEEFAAVLKRLDELEKSSAAKAAEKSADKTLSEEWTDLSIEKWTVKFGGHLQMDFIHWAHHQDPPVPASDYFEFRRLRLMADGTGYGVYDFRLQVDFEPESGDGVATPVTDVKDAYFTLHEVPYFDRLRIGNFFVPYSLEQVTNDTNNIFLERSIPTQGIFAADREVGLAHYGVSDDKNLTWTFGTFLDGISESLKERIDDNQGQRFSGRLTWLPYYDEPSNGRYLFHTGVGILHTDDQDGIVRFRARPQIHEGPFLIDSGNLAAGSTTSANIELATVWGPLSLQSELFTTNVNMSGADSVQVYGAYAYVSYFLTGENRIYERYGQHGAQFGRNVPFSNFFWVPGCCGPGAWEVKARWSNLTLSEVDSGQYNDLTLGFNWYWSDRTRIMFDYIHPVTSGGSTPFGATDSDIIGMRFDVNW